MPNPEETPDVYPRPFFHNFGPALITSRVSVFFFCFLFFFDTLCKQNFVMHPHHNNRKKIPIRKERDRERLEQRKRER